VRRRDGSKVAMSGRVTWKQEFVALWSYLQSNKVSNESGFKIWKAPNTMPGLVDLSALVLLFLLRRDNGYLSLATLFGPRTRSFIFSYPYVSTLGPANYMLTSTAAITIPSVVVFGKLLDSQRWSQRPKAWAAFLLWILPQTGCFIWVAFEYHYLGDKSALDYGS
jgi:hypothetical protein